MAGRYRQKVKPRDPGLEDDLRIIRKYNDDETEPGERTLDTWTVWASSGEYSVAGETIGHAYLTWMESHHDDFVLAITCDAMEPPLILREPV